jgi:hypothetical protein
MHQVLLRRMSQAVMPARFHTASHDVEIAMAQTQDMTDLVRNRRAVREHSGVAGGTPASIGNVHCKKFGVIVSLPPGQQPHRIALCRGIRRQSGRGNPGTAGRATIRDPRAGPARGEVRGGSKNPSATRQRSTGMDVDKVHQIFDIVELGCLGKT